MSAVLAGVYFYILLSGYLPEDGRPVIYGLIILFNYSAAAISIGLLMVFIVIVFMWIPEAIKRLPRWRLNAFAAGLSLAATLIACVSSLPVGGLKYVHVADATLNGRIFHLGARLAAPPVPSYYVLCQCDATGQFCQCRTLTDLGEIKFEEISVRPTLVADAATNTLAVMDGAKTLFTTTPVP